MLPSDKISTRSNYLQGYTVLEKLLVSQLINKCKDTTMKITNKMHYIAGRNLGEHYQIL
jgi:hypothetical protein